MEEIEVKFLDIDKEAIEQKLLDLGAEKIGEFFYKRAVFDYPGFTLDKDAAWIRLRDEGDKITMAYKRRLGVTSEGGDDEGMEEVEVEVNDFEKTQLFLTKIGLVYKFYLENKRVRYELGDTIFDIDTWPRLNPYLEIEAESWEAIDVAIDKLGLNPDDKKICSTTQIYAMNGINDKDYIKMTFEEFVKREDSK